MNLREENSQTMLTALEFCTSGVFPVFSDVAGITKVCFKLS